MSISQLRLPSSNAHQSMCDSFDETIGLRTELDSALAELSLQLAVVQGVIERSDGPSLAVASRDEVAAECQHRTEVELLHAQLAKLKELESNKDKKILEMQEELIGLERENNAMMSPVQRERSIREPGSPSRSSGSPGGSSSSSLIAPGKLKRTLNETMSVEKEVRNTELKILQTDKRFAELAKKMREKSDAQESLSREAAMLEAKLDVVRKQSAQSKDTIKRLQSELEAEEASAASSPVKPIRRLSSVRFADDLPKSSTLEETEAVAVQMRAEIEKVEKELAEARATGRTHTPRTPRDPAQDGGSGNNSPRDDPHLQYSSSPAGLINGLVGEGAPSPKSPQAMRRRSRAFTTSVVKYQQVTETLSLLKAFVFNLKDDIEQIASVVDRITKDRNSSSREWRQDTLSACFTDVVMRMQETDYIEEPAEAEKLLDAMRVLVIVWDLFETSLDDDIELILDRSTVRSEASMMLQAAQACVQIVAESTPPPSAKGRRKSSTPRLQK